MTTKHAVPLTPAMKKVISSEPATMEEALQNAQDLIDEHGGSDATLRKIRTFDGDIRSFESRIKTVKERMQEILEGINEYGDVVEAQDKLKTAKEALQRRLESNSEFMKLTEDLADERLSLKDAKENMSDFLLAYFADTHEKQIELGPKDAREVMLKGRLGKPKNFQTNLFTPPPINTNEGRKDLE